MKKNLFLSVIALAISIVSFSQMPKVSSGTIKRFENFHSVNVAPRTVDVWLPNNYDARKKYSVLYMHDGQMLFDSNTTWNKQAWHVDEVVSKLIAEKKIPEIIVVGVFNNGEYRRAEYFPEKALKLLSQSVKDTLLKYELKGNALADEYLQFLTKELKPFIDSTFSTYKDAKHTYIAGSSMGGLISMYALCEYPDVFGAAGCLSTHWIGSLKLYDVTIPNAFNTYLLANLPDPKNHKIYFDYGDKTLDSLYKPHQLVIDKTMQHKGFTSKNWLTREFLGEDHSEKAWHKRLNIPLEFLFKEN